MAGSDVTVPVVWETVTRNGAPSMGLGLTSDYGDGDTATALAIAADGVQRADASGLVAQRWIAERHDDTSRVILAVAAHVDADVIVLGTPGCGGVTALMLGSISRLAREAL